MPGIKITDESIQKASGNYFPNDADQSGIRDGQITQQDLAGSISGNIRPYKVYSALFSQSGTNDPTVTVLENELGGEIVWTRQDVGIYRATLVGAFPLGKTVIINNVGQFNEAPSVCIFHTLPSAPNGIELHVFNSELNYADYTLYKTFVEIRVYP